MSWDVMRCQEMSGDAKRCQEMSGVSSRGLPTHNWLTTGSFPSDWDLNAQYTTDSQQDPSLLTETWTHNIAGLQWRQMGREGLETATSYKQVTSSSFSPRAGKPFSTFSLCSLCLVFIIVSYSERTMTSQKEPTVQTCPKKVVSTEDLCLAPLRCWIFTLQASFKALHGPIAQSAIWERLTPTADIEQLNPLEEEWTNPRNFFECVFEHVPHFLTTKYVANPPTVG